MSDLLRIMFCKSVNARLRSLAGFAVVANVMLTSGCAADSDVRPLGEWTVSEQLEIREIRPGLWLHTSLTELATGVMFPSNGLIVKDGSQLLLIDTAWGQEITGELLTWIHNVLDLPIKLAIITHFHDDRSAGIPVLVERNIPFLASSSTAEYFTKMGRPRPALILNLEASNSMAIENIELYYPGAAHSQDNIVVWISTFNVLFGGCLVRSNRFPGLGNVSDANVKDWPLALDRIQRRYPDADVVVPGHGPVGDMALLTHTTQLLRQSTGKDEKQ